MEPLKEFSLIAPCGMNCGVCMAYLREKNKCQGCRIDDSKKSITRANCKIKNCVFFKRSKTGFCYGCDDFPCDRLKHLDKRYRTKYHMSMIENLGNIRKFGLKRFLVNEKDRWTCPECGGTICVHKGSCQSCGKNIFDYDSIFMKKE
ncbi:MAG: DUF3795 domain-containing protein [Candidatus Altiarchaeota archaeon]|nr:DUF3795 domain-containing protein [Candidatus Altiarchaeota archaeon]